MVGYDEVFLYPLAFHFPTFESGSKTLSYFAACYAASVAPTAQRSAPFKERFFLSSGRLLRMFLTCRMPPLFDSNHDQTQ
jgi:hypothetical protein